MVRLAKKIQKCWSVRLTDLCPFSQDRLDNCQNKQALHEAEKVLKKQPNFTCCKVLMALALARLGKEEQATKILDEILLKESPTEDAVLQAMSIAFREMHQTEKICTMYEKASAAEPGNEELLSHLFMAYVRMSDFKKQQRTAMQLFKVQPKNPYYFWAVMSVVLQTREVDEKTGKTLLLPLAERMIAKMQKEGKIDQEQETHLYLLILKMQGKHKEILEVLEGPMGVKLDAVTSFINLVPSRKLESLKQLDRFAEINVLCKEMLKKRY